MDETTVDAIHRLMLEMAEVRAKVRTMNQDLKDVAEQNDEYREIQDELKELTAKRATAKKLLEADKDYKVIADEVEELKFKLKDLAEIMSHHLVTYYDETRNTQIQDSDGEVRQLIISAKIGKPELGLPPQA
jgi:predicted nucleotidyltransferase